MPMPESSSHGQELCAYQVEVSTKRQSLSALDASILRAQTLKVMGMEQK